METRCRARDRAVGRRFAGYFPAPSCLSSRTTGCLLAVRRLHYGRARPGTDRWSSMTLIVIAPSGPPASAAVTARAGPLSSRRRVSERWCSPLQPDDLAGLGKAVADFLRRMAGGQSSWVREAARSTPRPASQARTMFAMHSTPSAGADMMPLGAIENRPLSSPLM